MSRSEPVRVAAGSGEYAVMVGAGLLGELPSLLAVRFPEVVRWAVISDERVAPLHADPVRAGLEGVGRPATLHTFPAGEAHKTREVWATLTDELTAADVGRDGGVVAVGGGVTGDLAGFVAATFMRGIPIVHAPTSVVAMVDSSIGGKTGVDTAFGKNLVGAFHAPRLVVADPEAIRTLPRRERAQGWAEAVKHGAIVDRAYLEELSAGADALMDGDVEAVERAVRRSVVIKADVVGRDEHESGLREILNFGHTFGHALETLSGYRLAHGSAVAIGMVMEAGLGEWLGVSRPGTAAVLARSLELFDLPVVPPDEVSVDTLLDALARDKKVRRSVPRFVLLEAPGSVAGEEGWARPVETGRLREWLATVGDGLVSGA